MAVSDKLYALRKKEGLSQEQLADKLNVSRQAISKWETGSAVPESEKLLAISKYFNVSLDYLMKDEVADTVKEEVKGSREKWIFGLAACVLGVISLMVWGLMSIFNPPASDRIGASSAINIDGNGIFLIICVVVIIFGAYLILKNTSRK